MEGGCMCGQFRYAIAAPTRCETLCHCSMCRRSTGAPAVAWLTVDRAGFRALAGALSRYRSSGCATRSFCPSCGTQILFEHDKYPTELDVTIGSLDDPNACPPRDHTRTESRLTWLKLCDELPSYTKTRDA